MKFLKNILSWLYELTEHYLIILQTFNGYFWMFSKQSEVVTAYKMLDEHPKTFQKKTFHECSSL